MTKNLVGIYFRPFLTCPLVFPFYILIGPYILKLKNIFGFVYS